MKIKSISLITVLGVPATLLVYEIVISLIKGWEPSIERIAISTITALLIWVRAKPISPAIQSEEN